MDLPNFAQSGYLKTLFMYMELEKTKSFTFVGDAIIAITQLIETKAVE